MTRAELDAIKNRLAHKGVLEWEDAAVLIGEVGLLRKQLDLTLEERRALGEAFVGLLERERERLAQMLDAVESETIAAPMGGLAPESLDQLRLEFEALDGEGAR